MLTPHDDTASLIAFYGDPRGGGQVNPKWGNTNLAMCIPPWRMVESWDTAQEIKHFVVHVKCLMAFNAAFAYIWNTCNSNQSTIEQYGLHLWGGCFNYRPIRGSSRISVHGFAAAIDLNPDANPMGHVSGKMPSFVVKAFKDQGATWGGDFQSRKDEMHFQFAHE